MTFAEKVQNLFIQLDKVNDLYALTKKTFEKDYSKSFYLPVYRMLVCYKMNLDQDFLSNLRQVLLYAHRRIILPDRVLSLCHTYSKEYGLVVDLDLKSVEARAYAMEDDEDLKYAYEFVKRRNHSASISDSALFNHFGYDSYISLQQKCMIYISKNLRQGETLLACLPTGSGKSLTWQAAVARGQFSKVTVVIVPTVALAIDHHKNDEITLARLPWIESIAYTSKEYSGHPEKMDELVTKIENGENTILYISPEGLTNYEISMALINAAKKNNISAVVIDETHLVIDWGMNFRPEFQFLPAFISKLKELSGRGITTLLLSATITEKDRNVLYELFGCEGMIEFRGDELRPEIEYYSKYCRTENDRINTIMKLIKTVPKPAIIYVGTVAQSKMIFKEIKDQIGYERIGLFHSEKSDLDKESMLEKWKKNKIDIMIATSAFGMGVDKSDVRTVITAYTPENISRFYQEVGRSGRDGYSSLNFILYCPEADSGVVAHFTDSKVISTENLATRWISMLKNNVVMSERIESNCVWIDTDTAPEHLKYDRTGQKNSGWNEDTISMLARASMIKIKDVRRQYKDFHKSFKIKVQMKDEYISILENENKLIDAISSFREQEREEINEGKNYIKEMISQKDKACFSEYFMGEFVYSEMTCSGCPYCRRKGNTELKQVGFMYINTDRILESNQKPLFKNSISDSLNDINFGYFSYDGDLSTDVLNEVIVRLIISGANMIVFEHKINVDMKLIRMIPRNDYLLLEIDEFIRIPEEMIFGSIVFVLMNDSSKNKKILKEAKKIQKSKIADITIVAPEEYYDEDEDRYLSDYTEYGRKLNIMMQEDRIC